MMKLSIGIAAIMMATGAMAQQTGSTGAGSPTGADAKVAVSGKKIQNSDKAMAKKPKAKASKPATMNHTPATQGTTSSARPQ